MTTPAAKIMISVLRAVGQKGISLGDLKKFASLRTEFGLGYWDHLRANDFLLDAKVLAMENGLIKLNALEPSEWLIEGLSSGDPDFLQLVEEVPRRALKFDLDSEVNARVGLEGEKYVIDQLTLALDPDLHSAIRHVSLTDDSLGFDISAPSRYEARGDTHLEVKTSVWTGPKFRFFLTRNEYLVAKRDRSWFLIGVRKNVDRFDLLGHLSIEDIQNEMPLERSPDFEWQNVKCLIGVEQFRPGLP